MAKATSGLRRPVFRQRPQEAAVAAPLPQQRPAERQLRAEQPLQVGRQLLADEAQVAAQGQPAVRHLQQVPLPAVMARQQAAAVDAVAAAVAVPRQAAARQQVEQLRQQERRPQHRLRAEALPAPQQRRQSPTRTS
jgi:hypothetical protein